MDITATATAISREDSQVKGLATAVLNGHIAIHGIRVIEAERDGEKGQFIKMPCWIGYANPNSPTYHDIAYPITSDGRKRLKDTVLEALNSPAQKASVAEAGKMPRVSVSLSKNNDEGNVKATGQIRLDDEFVISGVRIVKGKNGPFVQFPSYQANNGEWKEIAHPILHNAEISRNNSIGNYRQYAA